MPHTQHGYRLAMKHIPYYVVAEDCVAEGIWIGGLFDTSPHLWEAFQVLDTLNQFTADAICGFWVVLSDKGPQPLKIGDGLLRVDKPHFQAFGAPFSLAVPQERNQS